MTTPNLEDLKANVQAATDTNNAALNELAKQGIQIDAQSITSIRLAALVDHILGDMDNPQRLLHELHIQELLGEQIAAIRSQVARAKLTAGVAGAQLPPQGGLPNGARP